MRTHIRYFLKDPQTDNALPTTAAHQSLEHTHHIDFPPDSLNFPTLLLSIPSHCCAHSLWVVPAGGNRQIPCPSHGFPWALPHRD